MTEFGASATLSVDIPQRELRQARKEIEDELGEVPVSLSTSGRPSRQPRDPQTGQFVSAMGPEQFERTSLNLAEDRNALLGEILDEVQDGAGGGGGGGAGLLTQGLALKGLGFGTGSLLAGGAALTIGTLAVTAGTVAFASNILKRDQRQTPFQRQIRDRGPGSVTTRSTSAGLRPSEQLQISGPIPGDSGFPAGVDLNPTPLEILAQNNPNVSVGDLPPWARRGRGTPPKQSTTGGTPANVTVNVTNRIRMDGVTKDELDRKLNEANATVLNEVSRKFGQTDPGRLP